MTRHNTKQLLLSYYPTDAREQIFKHDMLIFLDAYPNCFERTLEIGHFTASCWLLNKAGDKALLMHHAKLDRWLQLGGHCDGNPDLLAVAIKEAQEESGIMGIAPVSSAIFDLDIHQIPENKKEKAHYHYDVRFLLQVISDEEVVRNAEAKALCWVDKNGAGLPDMNESIQRMMRKWINNC